MKKRLFLLFSLMCLLLVITLTSCNSHESSHDELEKTASVGLSFELSADGKSYISTGKGTCSDTIVVIPSTYNGLPVTSIACEAFYAYDTITEIIIPDSVTSIGEGAFAFCERLTSIFIGKSVATIGEYAFYYCERLTSIAVDESNKSFESIDGVLFNEEKTTLVCHPAGKRSASYEIPNSVTTIGKDAFCYCLIINITLGSGVSTIEENAFDECFFTSIDAVENNEFYKSIDGVLYSKDETTIVCCPWGKQITSFEILDSVTKIGKYAFSTCNKLKSIEFSNNITEIGEGAFSACYSLESIVIPASVTTISEGAFSYCERLTSITVDENNEFYKSIDGVLYDKNITTILCFPSSKTGTSFEIPNTVTRIGEGAFSRCHELESIIIPNSVIAIGDHAFNNCDSFVTIGDSVTSIGDYAFCFYSNPDGIIIPNSVTTIGRYAFKYCESLESIIIPNSVVTIKECAFMYCFNLTIYCEAESKPDGWDYNWNYLKHYYPVVWGYTGE